MILFAGGDLPGFKYIFWFALVAYATVIGSGVGYLIYFFVRKRKNK